MHIVHVISEYLPAESGGTQLHLRDLANAQRDLGEKVEIFTRLRGEDFSEYTVSKSEWEDVPVTRVTYNFKDFDRFELIFANPKMDSRFAAFLHETNPDLVHFHHFTCLSTTMADTCEELGVPFVITLHDYWLICPRGQRIHPKTGTVCEELDRARCLRCLTPLWPTLLPTCENPDFADPQLLTSPSTYSLKRWENHVRELFEKCAGVITPAKFHRDRFVEWGLDPARVTVIEHGLQRSQLLREPRGKRPVRRIGFVGTVIPSKGVHTLVDAFNRLEDPELELHIHGQLQLYHGEGGYVERLKSSLRPGKKMQLHGRYEHRQLANLFNRLDLLVVPSEWWETFCLTAREGALAGLPVIASNIGGIQDAVASGLALGFEPGDAEDLALAIQRVIDDDELRDSLTRKAELVRDMTDCAKETVELYRRVMEPAVR